MDIHANVNPDESIFDLEREDVIEFSFEDMILQEEYREILYECIARLPYILQAIIAMRFGLGEHRPKTLQQVANFVNKRKRFNAPDIGISVIRNRQEIAIRLLRDLFEKQGEET